MEQSEILSIAERLIPVYQQDDFDIVLSQLTDGQSPSAKLLVKMELNRLMQHCKKSIDLRGRVQGDCREYELDGITHWLDDVAFNAYHKNIDKFGGYTEGVWEALINTRNNFRVMQKNGTAKESLTPAEGNPFDAEPVHLGFNLRRQESRLRVQSQVQLTLEQGQIVHGLSIDLSSSGAKFKVPSAFTYSSGQIISVVFLELAKTSQLVNIEKPVQYRILAVEDYYDNDSVKLIRALRLTDTDVVARAIDEALSNSSKRARHDNQDKIMLARNRGYEHVFMKHTSCLPIFFQGNQPKLGLITNNNSEIWNYWHDERNQQMFGSLFTPERMNTLARSGINGTSCTLYAFKHAHENKQYFYSMLMPEATLEQRQLFWHLGAKRPSWRAFRISIYTLSEEERDRLAPFEAELEGVIPKLTHYGCLEELANESHGQDYLLTEKPMQPSATLNVFRHSRKVTGNLKGILFDTLSRRKEKRYAFKTPLVLSTANGLEITGHTVDLSKRGLGIQLDTPLNVIKDDPLSINFKELQLYDKQLPLDCLPYKTVRISPDGQQLQAMIEENHKTIKTIAFFHSIIEKNQDKLRVREEVLPSRALLEVLHRTVLNRMVTTPVFFAKHPTGFQARAIGVNYPLENYLHVLAKLASKDKIGLETLYKGRTNTLLAMPTRRIDGAKPAHHEIYLSLIMLGEKIVNIHSYLDSDFDSLKTRIEFVKKAKAHGEFYALRLSTAPIFNVQTAMLYQDLTELTHVSMHSAATLEKELMSLIGFVEIDDITEEVLIRLELT